MFRQLVPITLKLKEGSDYMVAKRMIEFLADKFQIKVQVIKGCFKLVESDIFIYVDSLQHIFLVFIDSLAFIKEVTEDASSDSRSQPSSLSHSSEESGKSYTPLLLQKARNSLPG